MFEIDHVRFPATEMLGSVKGRSVETESEVMLAVQHSPASSPNHEGGLMSKARQLRFFIPGQFRKHNRNTRGEDLSSLGGLPESPALGDEKGL
ncbi:hypothetical protein ACFFLM_09555 [Deinococcus oregonensis]|uniref:Uncharacterized protein n=1 Tax=Deinococcus oregonensis TaxID=1805970 RepID=A0ABV6AXH0_9DEIO